MPSDKEIEAAAKVLTGGFKPWPQDLRTAEAALIAAEKVREKEGLRRPIEEARTQPDDALKRAEACERCTGTAEIWDRNYRVYPCPDCQGDGTGKAETGQQQTSDEDAGSGNAPPLHGESADRASVGASAADPPERGSSTSTSSEELETGHPPIPDEATAKAATALLKEQAAQMGEGWGQSETDAKEWMDVVAQVEAAAPHIRASEREAIRERVEGLRSAWTPVGRGSNYYRAIDDCLWAIEGGEE